jgi:hypothetical protein
MCRPVGFVVGIWVVFGVVVCPVLGSGIPVISKLALRFAAPKPPEAHIHHLAPTRDNCIVGNSSSCGVVSLDGTFRLGLTHVNECLAMRNHFSCGDKEICKFGFSS